MDESFRGIIHISDNKYWEDDSGLRLLVGELSSLILNDDFEKTIYIVAAIENEMTQYREVVQTRFQKNGRITLKEYQTTLKEDTRFIHDRCVELQAFFAKSPSGGVFEKMLDVVRIAEYSCTPIDSLVKEKGIELVAPSLATDHDLQFTMGIDEVGQALLKLLNFWIEKITEKHHVLLILKKHYKPLVLHTFDQSKADRRNNFMPNLGWSTIRRLTSDLRVQFDFKKVNGIQTIIMKFIVNGLVELLYLDYIKIIENDVSLRKCANCDRFFVPENRSDEVYCSRIIENSKKTCKEIGPIVTYNKYLSQTPYLEARQKFYQSMHASLLRPHKSDRNKREEAKHLLKLLMSEADRKIEIIERLKEIEQQKQIAELFQWFAEKQAEFMPKKRLAIAKADQSSFFIANDDSLKELFHN